MTLCVLLVGQARGEKAPNGREIFRQQCSKCHGRNGEGVAGKFDGPLQGERSLDKLARYIERNMPDDAPGKCVGEDASAVARYIYESFYSREARLKSSKAPRVELLRLTKQQYLNSVSDLLQEFTGRSSATAPDSGLRATYYKSKGFEGDKQAFERIDREVSFNFGESCPDERLTGTNGYSIQWQGSLSVTEGGDYEFFIKTPNGARLWINDEQEPLIDAWVASGEVTEHKGTLRLVAGRTYPLKLRFFKAKEKQASVSLEWRPPHGAQQIIPAYHLLQAKSSPTFVVTSPFPPDDSSLGYERG